MGVHCSGWRYVVLLGLDTDGKREHMIYYNWLALEVLVKWLEAVLGGGTPSPHSS